MIARQDRRVRDGSHRISERRFAPQRLLVMLQLNPVPYGSVFGCRVMTEREHLGVVELQVDVHDGARSTEQRERKRERNR